MLNFILFNFFFLIYRPQKKQRTKELSQLFHSYNPYDHKVRHFIHLFISLGLEVNSQFRPLVLWILGMYFPNTMAMPPSSVMKSSECSVSFASPQRAFTWHKKQPLQVTVLSLWLWRVDHLFKTVPSCHQCSGWEQLSHPDYSSWMRQIESRRYIFSTICRCIYSIYISLWSTRAHWLWGQHLTVVWSSSGILMMMTPLWLVCVCVNSYRCSMRVTYKTAVKET